MGKLLTAPLFLALLLLLIGFLRLILTWRPRRVAFQLFLVTAGLALLSMPVVTARLASSLENNYSYPPSEVLETIDVMVVLSSNVNWAAGSGRAELDFGSYARTAVGARAFAEAEPRFLVMQGSLGGEHADLMALVMAELAVAMGVPEERVRIEGRSRNTRQHPVELLSLTEVEPTDVIGVVTSAWHLPRAVREYERSFEHVVPIPADYLSKQLTGGIRDWIPQARALADSTTVIHEWIGGLWYWGLTISPW